MIRLFIDVENDNTFSEEVDLVIESRLTYTLDETRDFGVIAIKSSKKATTYKPFTMVKITKMDGTSLIDYMVIAKDNVSFYGRGFNKTTNQYDVYYKHELRLEQLTYLLTRHMCREYVFSQPADNKISIGGGFSRETSERIGKKNIITITENDPSIPTIESNIPFFQQNFWKTDKNHVSNQMNIEIIFRSYISGGGTTTRSILPYITSIDFYFDILVNDSDDINTANTLTSFFSILASPNKEIIYADTAKCSFNVMMNDKVKYFPKYNFYFIKITRVSIVLASDFPPGYRTSYLSYYSSFIFTIDNYINYTHRDVIEKLALCTPIKFKSDIESVDYKPPFEVPETIDGIDLDAPSPQLNISQSNLFDAVSQWANYFSAIPTLTKENDTAPLVLGLEFPNINNGEIIDEDKMSGIEFELSNDDESYKDGQLAILKNITTDENFIYPSKNGFASVRSGAYGIVDSEDLRIELPHNIKEIKKIYIPVNITVYAATSGTTMDTILDLSYFIVEKDIYDLLPDNTGGVSSERSKVNCLYYTKGTNFIPIGTTTNPSGYFEGFTFDNVVASALYRLYFSKSIDYRFLWSPSDVWHSLFRVEYTPLVNSLRVRVESDEKKTDGEVLANQGSNQINVYRATANLYGLANRTGVEALNCSFKFTNWENRIKKGDILIRNNDYYYANIVSYVLYKDFIESYISFSKNFNRLSTYIGVDREKRFYEADNSLTKLSEDQINEYVYIFLADETDASIFQYASAISLQKPFWSKLLYTLIVDDVSNWDANFNKSSFLFSSLVAGSNYQRYLNGEWVDTLKSFTTGEIEINGEIKTFSSLYIPSFVYYGKNQISFHVEMKEPIVAGSYIFGSENNYNRSKVVAYTDEVGNFEYATIRFKSYKGSNLENEIAITQYLPFVFEDDLTQNNTEEILCLDQIVYEKDTNEIFSLDYNLYFVKANKYVNQIFFGDKLCSDNIIFKEENAIKVSGIYYDNEQNLKYTKQDLKGKGLYKQIGNNGASLTFNQIAFVQSGLKTSAIFKVSINLNDPNTLGWNSFALVDDDDNIILAVNRPPNINRNLDTLYFYIVSSNKRL